VFLLRENSLDLSDHIMLVLVSSLATCCTSFAARLFRFASLRSNPEGTCLFAEFNHIFAAVRLFCLETFSLPSPRVYRCIFVQCRWVYMNDQSQHGFFQTRRRPFGPPPPHLLGVTCCCIAPSTPNNAAVDNGDMCCFSLKDSSVVPSHPKQLSFAFEHVPFYVDATMSRRLTPACSVRGMLVMEEERHFGIILCSKSPQLYIARLW
jgi:hypothetical protein